jgi:ribosome recycling factor
MAAAGSRLPGLPWPPPAAKPAAHAAHAANAARPAAPPPLVPPPKVDYYGVPTPLKQLASISVPDASTLIVSPFDRSGLKGVEKAILESDVGINPNNDGEKIRLNIPPMTQVRARGRAGGLKGAGRNTGVGEEVLHGAPAGRRA